MINETKRKATWQELADRVDELQEKLDNSISKDKIICKIEEIEKEIEKYKEYQQKGQETDVEYYENRENEFAKRVLQELLKEE